MKQLAISIGVLFATMSSIGQHIVHDADSTLAFPTIEQLLATSEIIDNKTFDLEFLLRALPDNGWFLKLYKNSTYEYRHWSGWGEPEGTIIEKGKYRIVNNSLELSADGNRTDLASNTFYLITSGTTGIDNNITIDCAESHSKIYCLYHK